MEERKRLGLNQEELGVIGGVTKHSQLAYEKGTRKPDSSYLEAVAAKGVDVGYLLTGLRTPVSTLTPEQAALLDNYENADEEGRDAARRVLVALSKSKAAKKAA